MNESPFENRKDLESWARGAGYSVDDTAFSIHGTKCCIICGEPLAAVLGGVAEIGEFVDGTESVVAHAQCAIDDGLVIA